MFPFFHVQPVPEAESSSFRHCHDLFYHLINCLLFDLFATLRTVRNSDSCIHKSEIIIDFRYGSYCGTWISVRRFLVNGNCRRKSLNAFYIRFFHLSQELSCIRRQRFHVSSLSFRINRIKCQRRFSRTTESCQYYKFISRNIHIYILQIMLIRSSDLIYFSFSCTLLFPPFSISHISSNLFNLLTYL